MFVWQQDEAEHSIYGWQQQRKRAQRLFIKGKGAFLWDEKGRCHTDLCSGQINVNVGYSHQRVVAAMKQQLEALPYVAPYFATEPRITLSRKIAEHSPGDLAHVFFTNGGSDAVENALKVARMFTGRSKILAAWQSYHGATVGASSVSGDPRRFFAEPAQPGVSRFHVPGQYRSPYGDSDPHKECQQALETVVLLIEQEGPDRIAAILIEPIIGTSGLYVLSSDFLLGLRKICDRYGILLIVDEVMSGWGRSGKWFACDHHNLSPDILVTAKGITSGYVPLGAVVMSPRIYSAFFDKPFVGGLTTEAHALACSAGVANIEIYENEGLIENSAQLGTYMKQRLELMRQNHACVGDIRGQGLFCCIELTKNQATRTRLAGTSDATAHLSEEIFQRCLNRGLLLIAKKDFIFVAPPLNIEKSVLDDALDILDEILDYVDSLVSCNAT